MAEVVKRGWFCLWRAAHTPEYSAPGGLTKLHHCTRFIAGQSVIAGQSLYTHQYTCILPDDSHLTLDTRDWNCTPVFSYNIVTVLNSLQNLLTGENVNSGDIEAILDGFEHLASQVYTSRAILILRAYQLQNWCMYVSCSLESKFKFWYASQCLRNGVVMWNTILCIAEAILGL